MKIDMQILTDELSPYCSEAKVSDRPEDKLLYSRPLGAQQQVDPKYVYVATYEQLLKHKADRNLSAVIYVGNCKISELELYQRTDVIHLDTDFDQALEMIQKVFDKYNEWDERLCRAIMENGSIQELSDIAAEVLVNPIAFFDSSFYCIAKSGRLPGPDTDNPIWKQLMINNHPLIGDLNRSLSRQLGPDRMNKPTISFAKKMQLEDTKPFDYLAFYMFKNGSRVCNMGTTELWSPISYGQYSLCEHLHDRFQLWAEHYYDNEKITPDVQVILNLLAGKHVPADIIQNNVVVRNIRYQGNLRLA